MSVFVRLRTISRLVWLDSRQRLASMRMLVLLPLLALFICGAAWGFSDPDADLPSNIGADSPADVLYLTSLFVLFSATLGVVLVGFDAISRPRLTGELAIELAQPIRRVDLALSHLLSVWFSVYLPTALLSGAAILLIHSQMGVWPTVRVVLLWFAATGLLLLWYASLQLLASMMARDFGSAVTIGVATWMLFTLIWLLVTVVLATMLGVSATDTTDPVYRTFAAKVDLLSPNGVYQLLLQTMLDPADQPLVSTRWIGLAAAAWTVLPLAAYLRGFKHLTP